jgi:nucleoside phosphorylase
MEDIKEYLPKSRLLFRKFLKTHLSDYYADMREARVGPGTGYWYFYRSGEVIQHLRDIVHNLGDTFGNVEIPGVFSSPKRLVDTWNQYYELLKSREELLTDVISSIEKGNKNYPEPFNWTYRIHKDVTALLEEILNMSEVKEFIEQKVKEGAIDIESKEKNFDIAIITALHDTEFEAFKNLPGMWVPYLSTNDSTTYLEGKIGTKSILLATDDKMGMAASSALSTKIISKFSPKYLIMGGIAGGVKDVEKSYGDVLVARYTWNYESGKYKYNTKTKTTVFEPNPEQIELSASLVRIINELKSQPGLLTTIESGFTATTTDLKPNEQLKVILGPVASGSAVLADKKKVADLRRGNRKLIGIDMETFGVFYATKSYSSSASTEAMSIKSISDFADHRKNDKYRKYAAYTSAQFVYQLILQKLQ